MGNKLIIIGNGFDLHANLASKFSDFFQKNEKPLIEEWLFRKNNNFEKDISFLSLLLYNSFYRRSEDYEDFEDARPFAIKTANFQKEFGTAFGLQGGVENWMDVEGFIKQVLVSKGLQQLITSFNDNFLHKSPYSDRPCICPLDCLPEFFSRSHMAKQYFAIKDFYSFFLEEIKLFERRFADYLKSEMEANKEYRSNVNWTFKHLIADGNRGLIINFNFTSINPLGSFEEINVHGTLGGDVIIGIDERKLDGKPELIPFTKTFRKLVSGDPSTALSGEYDEIVIYGHSLGEQDYSYFQSIFDYCQLYQSKTVVRFIYSDYFIKNDPSSFENPKNDHRIHMAMKLFGLLKEYGQTQDNKEHGKNMIHKMILEGRLKFELNNFMAEESEH